MFDVFFVCQFCDGWVILLPTQSHKVVYNGWCMRAHISLCNYFMYNQIRLVSGIVNIALFLSSYFFYLCFMHLYGKMFLFLCNRYYEIKIMWQEFCFTINKVSVLKSFLLCPWQSYISHVPGQLVYLIETMSVLGSLITFYGFLFWTKL